MRETISIACLGASGSGKTTFLGGVEQSMISSTVKSQRNGVCVSMTGSGFDPILGSYSETEDNEMGAFATAIEMESYDPLNQFSTEDKDGNILPGAAGTVESRQFFFNFNVAPVSGKCISEKLSWLDYRGGLLNLDKRTLDDSDRDECQQLVCHLRNSEVIFILLDGEILSKYEALPSICKKMTGADRINMIMNNLFNSGEIQKNLSIVILLTKVDSESISADLKKDNYLGLCKLATETLDTVTCHADRMEKRYGWSFHLIPISVIGEGSARGNIIKYNANIKPFNIDLAMLFAVQQAASRRLSEINDKKHRYRTYVTEQKNRKLYYLKRSIREEVVKAEKKLEELKTLSDRYYQMLHLLDSGFPERFASVRSLKSVA